MRAGQQSGKGGERLVDILESGMERAERPPSRPRTVALSIAALALVGGAYWLHQPDKRPAPVATATETPTPPLTPTPTPTPTAPPATPEPTATIYPYINTVVTRTLSCTEFLDAVQRLAPGEMGLKLINDKRTPTTRDVSYHARTSTGTVRVHAQCGPTSWKGLVGQHVGDPNGDYIDLGARSNEPGGPRPSVAIFRADNSDGWYFIQAADINGRLGDGASMPRLMATIAHTPLINFRPPGAAGQD